MSTSIFDWTSDWLKAQGLPHEAFSICDSTNDLAKQLAFTSPAISVYLADQQARGRGRGENTWTSPAEGSSLMITWSFELTFPPQQLSAPIIGLHLYKAVSATWPKLNWSLKAPNDLYLNEKKVAGLLVESVSRGRAQRLIIGLGMNILSTPGHLEQATHLQAALDSPLLRPTWQNFLSALYDGFKKANQQVGLVQLPSELCKELFEALKKNPHSSNLKEVSPHGDLIFPDRTLAWAEL